MTGREVTMIISHEFAEAAKQPQGVRLTDPQTNREYVLVSAEVFDRLRELCYDDSPWTDEEQDAIRAEALDQLGWEGMETYQDERE
jgi:hypothetical protein